ncbi:MAG TPA: inositol monophosphatase family protein [Pseudorhodoplanes sp.]|jgi:myo-inositol-1(or 4)-monophosphatase|nr:inositol monophosphatase family protein [Pseudorhodoplanes sp.]
MSKSDLDERLSLARDVAREGGAMMLSAFRGRGGEPVHTFKGSHDYLTETDGAIERMVRGRIAAAFPADSFLGEETVGDKTGAKLGRDVWVVDPIDGTANFARGVPHFCISIAFVRDNRCEIGVVYDPIHDELYAARRGSGATRNGMPIRVSGIEDIGQSIVEAGWSLRVPNDRYLALVEELYRAGAQVKRAGSGTLGLAYVADGRSDAYCELHINSWDALAALLLVEEAGGYVNDFLAHDGLRRGNAVLGCTPAISRIVLRAMKLQP